MPEKFTLRKRVRQRSAIDRYIWFVSTAASFVYEARQKLFSGPAFALNEHGGGTSGDVLGHLQKTQKLWVPGHDAPLGRKPSTIRPHRGPFLQQDPGPADGSLEGLV